MQSFSAFIPLGPGLAEHERAADLIRSLVYYEPAVSLLIIVEDGVHDAHLLDRIEIPRACRVVTIPHPRPNNKLNLFGGLCTADLIALHHVCQQQSAGFVLKLDTDSLVIGPFSAKVEAVLQARPKTGTMGALGDSCNRAVRSFAVDQVMAQAINTGVRIGLSTRPPSPNEVQLLEDWGVNTPEQQTSFRRICRLLAPLLDKSFSGAHCQGGAYVISKCMITRLSYQGLLDDPLLWQDLKLGEDQMMGALSALTDLEATDFSECGEVFGIQAIGLPYSPSELLSNGYSIIHSVKNCDPYLESQVRIFFRNLRRGEVPGFTDSHGFVSPGPPASDKGLTRGPSTPE